MSACIEARYSVPRGELVHSGYDDKRPPLCPRTGFRESEVLEAGRRMWWLAERVEEAREWERGVRASLEEAEGQLARSRARVVAGGGWRLEVERNLEAAFARVAER